LSRPEKKNEKQKTENGKRKTGNRSGAFFVSGLPFSVSCFQFPPCFGSGSSGLGKACRVTVEGRGVVREQSDSLPLVSESAPPSPRRRVKVLPPAVAAQIAAGEVVERPASVVKELVENAIDAGARRIQIELEGAGSELIAVADDGEGMDREDAVCAFERHATSKVSSAADLGHIATLGFRGEALASIAAVSRTTLITRRGGELAGCRVELHYGKLVDVRAAGTPPGTRVEVCDLFGSVPARRKFLKAPATEVGHVTELVTRTALAFPQVGFVLRHGRRALVEFAPVADPSERIVQVYGAERCAAMLPFAGRGAAGRAHGWLSDARLTFPSARHIYTYVNQRYVRDKLVSHALVAGYSTLLMHGRYPAAAVFLELPLEDVDVNVHPAKSEVRFRRAGAVHELLSQAVQLRLRERTDAAPKPVQGAMAFDAIPWKAVSTGAPVLRLVDLPPYGASAAPPAPATWSVPVLPRSPATSGAPATPAAGFFASLRIIGQAFDGYLIGEDGNQLVLIDQHAAHERVTFEHLRTAYSQGAMARQQLLVPTIVELGPREMALLGEHAEEVRALGFDVEPFGGTSVAVRAVPALLSDTEPAALLRDVAEELTDIGGSRRLAEAAESVLARLACHSAVRVGQRMGPGQIQALLNSMDRISFAGHCPHGRPAYVTVPRSELERWFKRA
jgi:DNA mismatch repair protein MutL